MADLARPLDDLRILSLALNLPGPAALMRCRRMGATCVKLEPPAGDPMRHYDPAAYAELHEGVQVRVADLKATTGQAVLHDELARTDVLLTSFRPSALARLGLRWNDLHALYPSLFQVSIVGGPGAAAEVPGHDLTYLAEHGLVSGTVLPPTLFADMAGSLMASEAVVGTALLRARGSAQGRCIEVALADAAGYLALPRHWGLTGPTGAVGGAHAGYRVYACKDGRVAVAALEPHFAATLCAAAGLAPPGPSTMQDPATHAAIASFLRAKTRADLDALAAQRDLPLHTLPA
jgi:crotonobetainyl-CoA:carnitine CoA-transferase CaiB-like acyl-CoA transferase